jgi:2,3-bisphosphoglycerate-independent phosphoglycerate mutase
MKKPVILVIMDGYGIRDEKHGNAIAKANKPNLDAFFSTYPSTLIEASGIQVGLPVGQMGNSEVGHLNIGAGRVVYQSLTLIDKAIMDESFYKNPTYIEAMEHVKKHKSKLHILGLLSDGGVHSHINHFKALFKMVKQQGLETFYLHGFMDGRDVSPQLGPSYVETLVEAMKQLNCGQLASLGGRYFAMDRDKNLARTGKAYDVLVEQKGDSFKDYKAYFQTQYQSLINSGKDASDEFLTPMFVEGVNGKIEDNDAIIFLNFRPDRGIQLSTLLTNPTYYSNPKIVNGVSEYIAYTPITQRKNLFLVQTMKYADSVKGHIAFKLPTLDNTLGPWLAKHHKTQLRIAETEKYPHVTFFFDGTINYDGVENPVLPGARRVLVNSPKVETYDLQPEMSAYEVKDLLLKELDKGDLDVAIVNFANCDMVGHTAVEEAVVKAVEVVDECVGSIIEWTNLHGGHLIVTADHGNADMILTDDGKPHTAHTTNLVPVGINNTSLTLMKTGGKLGNLAPTILDLLQLEQPAEMTEQSLIVKR